MLPSSQHGSNTSRAFLHASLLLLSASSVVLSRGYLLAFRRRRTWLFMVVQGEPPFFKTAPVYEADHMNFSDRDATTAEPSLSHATANSLRT